MHRICASILSLSLLSWSAATAAEIDVQRLGNGSVLIVIEGDFEQGDIEAFRKNVASLSTTRVAVAFRSDGGSLVAGIRIGSLIREKKFATVIPDGAACASACALAWLGGTRRFMGQGSSVGFHAAYVLKSYGPIESGSGNAILGAYLNQLGLSENAILHVTKTAPTSIQWMSLEDVTEQGIAVAPLSPQHARGSGSAGGTEATPERRAIDFVRSLLAQWSRPGAEALPAIEGLYAETVVYHGKSTPRDAVLRSKRRIADRWSERTYSIRPGSLTATCPKGGGACRVKGVVTWKYFEPKTTKRSAGHGSFEYRVDLGGAAPQIAAETRIVEERPSAVATRLKKARQDFQQLLAKVSKLIP
jgi:hypothetical protein